MRIETTISACVQEQKNKLIYCGRAAVRGLYLKECVYMAKYKKRKDGRYLVQVQIGLSENGKPKYKNIYGRTIPELEKKEREYRQELEKGIVVDDQGMTVGEWAWRWLELYKSNIEHNSKEVYRIMIKAHIVPAIGNIKLKNLKTHHVQELINSKLKDHTSARTAEKIKMTMGQIIKQAIINEFIYKDIMLGIEMPKKIKKEKRVLTDAEIKHIRSAALDLKEKVFLFLLLYTGLRRGEVLALSQNDISLKKSVVSVNKATYFKNGSAEIKAPKSQSGVREIPLTTELVQMLADYLKTLDSIYLFPDVKGGLMSSSSFRAFWSKIITKLSGDAPIKTFNINKDITPHVFRHTYATILYNAGVDIKTAQSYLGHSSISITMDIYTHLDKSKSNAAVEKLEAFIGHF